MNILAFAPSGNQLSIAIQSKQGVASHRIPTAHLAEQLVPSLHKFLGSHSIPIEEIDQIIVSRGPASFTGIRVCFAAAKALVLGGNISLITLHGPEAQLLDWLQSHPVPYGGRQNVYSPMGRKRWLHSEFEVISAEQVKLLEESPIDLERPPESQISISLDASQLLRALPYSKTLQRSVETEQVALCEPTYFGTSPLKKWSPPSGVYADSEPR